MSLQNPIERNDYYKDSYDNSAENSSMRHELALVRERTIRGIGRATSAMYNLFKPGKHETQMTSLQEDTLQVSLAPEAELRPVSETIAPENATPEELSFLLYEQALADKLNMIDYAIRSNFTSDTPTARPDTQIPYEQITEEESATLEGVTNRYLDSIESATSHSDSDKIREGIISLDSIYLLMRSMSYRKDDERIKSALGTILENLDDNNHRELIKPIRTAYETTGNRAIMDTYLQIIDDSEWNMDDMTGARLPDDYVKEAFSRRGIQLPRDKFTQ